MRWKAFIDRQGSYSAVIVEYRLREQTYYRVRVGSFSSAEQAQRAAKELGLNPAAVWIVRIE
jgi:cell division protein FtsN